jgi:hypothetical protein
LIFSTIKTDIKKITFSIIKGGEGAFMKILLYGILMLALFFLMPESVIGQDFSQLLEAVDDVEANLVKQLESEKSERESQISEIKAEMHNTIALLNDAATGQTGKDEEHLDDIMAELNRLRVEVQNLKKELSNNAKQLASIDSDNRLSPGPSDEQINEMSEKLVAISNRISNMSLSDNQPAEASQPLTGLRISGFFDVNGTYQSAASDNTQFDLGQVEIDLDHDVSERTYVRITPVWNNGEGVLSLGPAYVRVQLMDPNNGSITQLSISAGKMDVPFGIGLLENGSVNRKIPTRPKAIQFTHGGWGDYGLQIDLKYSFVNFAAYGVNGFASTAEVDSAMSLSLGLPEGSEINTTPSYAFGTRVGVTPISALECGISFAAGQNESNRNEMMLVGADLQYAIGLFNFKGEYIYHSLNRSVDETNNRGYYFESRFSTGRWILAGRYGSFKPDSQEWNGRFAMAAGYGVTKNIEVKFESLFNENASDNVSTVQLMTKF